MALITLQDDQLVKVPAIDTQHRQLVDIINQLHTAMSQGAGPDVLGGLIDTLIEHTRTHFRDEERLMTDAGFPGLAKHKAEHDRLLQHIVDLAQRFRAGDALLSFAVMIELKGWALVHIEKFDIALGAFLNRRTTGGPAASQQ